MGNELFKTVTIATRASATNDPLMILLYVVGCLLAIATFVSLLGLVLIYVERKVAAHFQCRLGPMRVGPHGILQSVADGLKLLQKEDIVPFKADALLHVGAPFFAILATLLSLLIIPMSPVVNILDLNIGVLYLTGVGGFGVLGILVGGWSSNNKWSLIGAMRAGAQIISYEISATLALLVIVLFSGSLNLTKIIESQASGWWIWRAHGIGLVAFLMFFVSGTAEINRTPFDIPEGESELGGGFHTEYSGLRFGLFFLAEFINMFIMCALASTLFLGGWMPFHIGDWTAFNQTMDLIPAGLWFTVKTSFLVFVLMWFRWTFPRLRVDQLMTLEWKILLPIGFINLIVATLVCYFNFYFFP